MKKFVNTSMLISAVLILTGSFLYKKFGSQHVIKLVGAKA